MSTEWGWIIMIGLGIGSCTTMNHLSQVEINKTKRHYIDKGFSQCPRMGSRDLIWKKNCEIDLVKRENQ